MSREENVIVIINDMEKNCLAEQCYETPYAKGYCKKHYQRLTRRGSLHDLEKTIKYCSVEQCNEKHYGNVKECDEKYRDKGFCAKHYHQIYRTGSLSSKKERRKRGLGSITDGGYKQIIINGKKYFEHRYIMEQHIGRKLLPTEVVHHINHDRLDNKIENLQLIESNAEHMRQHMLNYIANEAHLKKLIDRIKALNLDYLLIYL